MARLGLGLAALGRPAYITLGRQSDLGADRSAADLERRCHAMLDAAYAAGIRYIDAARSYGLAEQYESNPRSVWGYVQGLTRLSQRTPWQDGRFALDRTS